MCLDDQDWEHKRITSAEQDWQKTRAEMHALEDLTRKERIKKTGAEHMAKMKELFGCREN